MTPEKLDDVMRRALQFQMMELPGQWPMMHMGTLYLVNDLARAVSELRADRTPDPAQIRADALREVLAIAQEAVARRIAQIEEERKKPAFNIDVPQMMRWGAGKLQAEQIADEIRALIDAPLSPTAVDNSPAPDAGGKEGV